MSPPVFVNYRRADEPFAAALLFAVLGDRWGGDPVFLDTRFLGQRGDVSRQLIEAVTRSELVLAVIGPRWDDQERRKRLSDPQDWVRRELTTAALSRKPVVPVLVDREDVPTRLPFAPVPDWGEPIRVSSADFWQSIDALVNRASVPLGAPAATRSARTPPQLVHLAADAMLRHVLPAPQRRMRNGAMIARVVGEELGEQEWLRFVATANLPGRPNGSCIVWVTAEHLGVADLGADFRPRTPPTRVPLAEVREIRRVDQRRMWKPVTDLRLDRGGGGVLHLQGLFAEEADELLEALEWALSRS